MRRREFLKGLVATVITPPLLSAPGGVMPVLSLDTLGRDAMIRDDWRRYAISEWIFPKCSTRRGP
jgi:hypothetical protein